MRTSSSAVALLLLFDCLVGCHDHDAGEPEDDAVAPDGGEEPDDAAADAAEAPEDAESPQDAEVSADAEIQEGGVVTDGAIEEDGAVHAPEPPCERDGKLLPSGTPCLTETEPAPLCFLAGYNSCYPRGPNEFWQRFGTRTCSGSSAACDGPWLDGGETETGCDQDFDVWCVCNLQCGIDVCEPYVGC